MPSNCLSTTVPTLASGYLHYNGSAFVWDTPQGICDGAPTFPVSTISANDNATSSDFAACETIAVTGGLHLDNAS